MSELPGPDSERLREGVVHVWAIDLHRAEDPAWPASDPPGAERGLRAKRRVHARWRSREILARYLGCSPQSVPIERAEGGKPSLKGYAEGGLSYNLAHSGAFALVAVSSGQRVGVDLEHVRPTVRAGALASRFFSSGEADSIGALPDRLRLEAFFRTWTRKEAYIKGLGGTVPGDLGHCEIVVDRAGTPQIAWTRLESTECSRWSIRDLEAPLGCVAALATEGEVERIVTVQG